jgi:hypothetical protein
MEEIRDAHARMESNESFGKIVVLIVVSALQRVEASP